MKHPDAMIPLPEITTYSVSLVRKILCSLYLCGLVPVFILMVLLVAKTDSSSLMLLAFLLPGLALVGFVIYWMIKDMSSVLAIQGDQVIYKTLFSRRSIALSEIRGYRSYFVTSTRAFYPRRVIILYPTEKDIKEIQVSEYIKNQKELITWLEGNFENAAVQEFVKEKEIILQNPAFGETVLERKEYLEKARKVSIVVNIIGAAVAIVMLVWPKPHYVVLIASILYVPLTFVVVYQFKGIIYFNNKTESPHPYVGLGIILCCIGLLVRGIFDYDLLHYGPVWMYASLVTLVTWGLLLSVTTEFAQRTSMDIANMVAILFFLVMYGFGFFVITNCLLDTAPGKKYSLKVIDKHIYFGKNTTDYYLKIQPAGPIGDEQLTVSEKEYSSTQTGDSIMIKVKPGRWGSEWIFREP